jgi:hypothetical protein
MAVDLGDLYRCSWTNVSPSGGNVNAGVVTLTITLPDQTTTVVTPISPTTTGVYTYDYQTVQAGRHRARWVGTGTNPGAQPEQFDVRPADPGYIISLADAKQQLNQNTSANDEEVRYFVEATTAVVEQLRGETIAVRTFTEEREVRTGKFPLARTPVQSLTSVATVDGFITWDITRLHVSPAGVVAPNPYVNTGLLELKGWIKVVYTAGYQIVPANVGLAARIIVQHLWQTQRPERGAGSRSTALGETSVPGMGYAVPNRALELLGSGMPGFA